MPDSLKITRDGGVVRVELNRPDEGNLVDEAVLDALDALLGEIRYETDVRALILSGAGGDFCLGGDRMELGMPAGGRPGAAGAVVRRLADKAKHVCDALSTLPAVTIARVHGRSNGAGVLLAVSCDLRVGTQDCSFRLPELSLGLPAAWAGGLARLISEVGIAKTREMVLIGNVVTADDALGLSILHRVAATADDADAVVDAWVRPLLRRSETVLRATKDLFNAYARSAVQGDVTTLDSTILSSVLTAQAVARSGSAGSAGPVAAGAHPPGPEAPGPEAPGSEERQHRLSAWMRR